MTRSAFILLAMLLCGTLGCGNKTPTPEANPSSTPEEAEPDAPAGPGLFRDVTREAGVDFTYRNGEEQDRFSILESLGGGVALIDHDGDGLLDIFLPGGGTFSKTDPPRLLGHPGKLYKNLGGWKFRDVTTQVGLGGSTFYTHGAAVADYDGDGWPDLLVTGYAGLALYHNQPDGKGGRRFVDVTERVGLQEKRWTTSAAWADLSGKGRPDLYVCRYLDWSFTNDPRCTAKGDPKRRDVCDPHVFKPLPHALFRNDGNKFQDVSTTARLRSDGKGLGVVIADLNDDGRPDVYVANDATVNFLYLNGGDGKFTEAGLRSGVAVDDDGRYNGSMGVDVGDYDGSGRPSLWVTNFQGELHALYQNLGQTRFSHQSALAGIAALGRQYVGFGTGLVDFDNDGWLDLVFVNGHVVRYPVGAPFRQRPILLRNTERSGRRFFVNASRQGGEFFQVPALGRGLAVGDLDNDGWPDLIVSHTNSPVAVLRNNAPRGAHWLGIRLVGKNGRPVEGATVSVEVEGRRLTRFARGGGSYLSAGDPRLLFGLGDKINIGRVSVRWPWGATQHFEGLTTDRYWELREQEPRAR